MDAGKKMRKGDSNKVVRYIICAWLLLIVVVCGGIFSYSMWSRMRHGKTTFHFDCEVRRLKKADWEKILYMNNTEFVENVSFSVHGWEEYRIDDEVAFSLNPTGSRDNYCRMEFVQPVQQVKFGTILPTESINQIERLSLSIFPGNDCTGEELREAWRWGEENAWIVGADGYVYILSLLRVER